MTIIAFSLYRGWRFLGDLIFASFGTIIKIIWHRANWIKLHVEENSPDHTQLPAQQTIALKKESSISPFCIHVDIFLYYLDSIGTLKYWPNTSKVCTMIWFNMPSRKRSLSRPPSREISSFVAISLEIRSLNFFFFFNFLYASPSALIEPSAQCN